MFITDVLRNDVFLCPLERAIISSKHNSSSDPAFLSINVIHTQESKKLQIKGFSSNRLSDILSYSLGIFEEKPGMKLNLKYKFK